MDNYKFVIHSAKCPDVFLLQTELVQQLRDFCDELREELTALYEPLWETGVKTRTVRSALRQGTPLSMIW